MKPRQLGLLSLSIIALASAACTQVPDAKGPAPSGVLAESAPDATPTSDAMANDPANGGATTGSMDATSAMTATADEPLTGPKILVKLGNGKSFTLQLDATNAPKSSEGIAALVKKGFYDGTVVHRVEPSFVVQWGDPYSKKGLDDPRVGTGGSGSPLPFEPGKMSFKRGVLGVASKGAGTGGDGQIFVMTGDSPSLDGGYAAIGKVTQGMDVVDAMVRGDKIVSMKIEK